ncbi:MAG: sugar phosphate isomerase/epimerase, partial [Actinobacteria bacterium]|nr:sugar phosphate isomerase/epimerase [Actinomycetota bacterium]
THLTLSSVRPDPRARAAALRAEVDEVGLEIADVFLTSSLELGRLTPTSRVGDDVDELRAIFRDTVELTSALGAPGITLLPGVVDDGLSVDEGVARAAEGLAPLVEMGAERGLGVSVEPHFGSCIETPEATSQLLEQCPGLMITLDPSHFAYVGCTAQQMAPLAPRTRHVQIRPGGPGVMQSKVRDNQIDLRVLFDALHDAGYDGWVACEYVWMQKWGCDEVDNLSETKLLADLLRGLVAEVWS